MKNSTFREKPKLRVLFCNCLFTIHYNAESKQKINYLKDESIMELIELGQPAIERKVDYFVFPSITKSDSMHKSDGVNYLYNIKFFLS